MSIEDLARRFFREPDLPEGESTYIRRLKKEEKHQEAEVAYKESLREAKAKRVKGVLDKLKSEGQNTDALDVEHLNALLQWQNVREAFRRNEITPEQLGGLRDIYSNIHNQTLDDETVQSGLRHITKRTVRR